MFQRLREGCGIKIRNRRPGQYRALGERWVAPYGRRMQVTQVKAVRKNANYLILGLDAQLKSMDFIS